MTPEDEQPPLRYMLDENVSRRVAELLNELGRETEESRNASGLQAADYLVERAAAEGGYVLITHDKHFKSVVVQASIRDIRPVAPVLWLRVEPFAAADRLRACISVVEHLIHDSAARSVELRHIEIRANELRVTYHLPDQPM
jgi:predicted nuclease of predicted toxin-antitoxin system